MKRSFFIYTINYYLVICGLKGRTVFNLKKNLSYFLFFVKNENFFLIELDENYIKKSFIAKLKNGFYGINSSFSKKLNLVGTGFRCWTFFENDRKFLIIKMSLSKDCVFCIPKTIDVFCLNFTTILIRGLTRLDIDSFVSVIKSIKKPNFYKWKGIFCENEVIKLKVGKKM